MTGWSEDGLAKTWRALAERLDRESWRFVRLIEIGPAHIEAARNFPGSREAILISLPKLTEHDLGPIPKGRGFEVSNVSDDTAFPERTVLALAREEEGSPEIFSAVVVDVIRQMEEVRSDSPFELLQAFLTRVREWQSFMERSRRALSSDRQLGLLAELKVLGSLLRSELGSAALTTWKGPLRSAFDFQIANVGVEIKSTTRAGAFIAQIGSIEQLDNECRPMFLCALRFQEHEDGESLPEFVAELRGRLGSLGCVRAFDALLMMAGYFDEHQDLYSRRLLLAEARVFEVNSEMPHLTRAMLPAAVRSVAYGLDLDAMPVPATDLSRLFHSLGLTFHES
jgi:hypothetical protein